jgi:NADH-quinone oxidoreductase subunit C
MADDNGKQEPPSGGADRPPSDTPAPEAPAEKPATAQGDAKPAVPKPPPKKPAPPPKPKGPQKQPWTGALIDSIAGTFPDEVVESYTFLGLRHLHVRKERIVDVLAFLRTNATEPFDFLSDETATHWPADEEFELVYVLLSFATGARIVVKARTSEWEAIDSATSVWPGANWLEREIYDMFGVRFEGHPNLKRILLPDDWTGFPLRKDYDMRLQDVEWVRKHLGIDSGQKFYVGKARHEETVG